MAENIATHLGDDDATNEHICVTLIEGDERKRIFLALREAFMLR
jgi:hypothetical protein